MDLNTRAWPEGLAYKTFEMAADQERREQDPLVYGPGVFGHLVLGTASFCLRAIAVKNREETYQDFLKGSDSLLEDLRFGLEIERPLLVNFPTLSFEQAQYLVEDLANMRFPLRPGHFFNFGDPGSNWSMGTSDHEVVVTQRSTHGAYHQGEIEVLGPLWREHSHDFQELKKGQEILKEVLNLEELVIGHKEFRVRPIKGHEKMLRAFTELFGPGRLTGPLAALSKVATDPDIGPLYEAMLLVCAKRRLWPYIQSLIEKRELTLH